MEEQDRIKLESLFEEYCTDGVVTKVAFKTILQCMENDPTDAAIDEVFSNFDNDKHAGLSKEEFNKWINKCWIPKSKAKELIVDAFRTIFKNQETENGRYPIDTLVNILKTRGKEKLTDEEAKTLLKELETIDRNGDRNIDEKEFALFLHDQQSCSDDSEASEAETEESEEEVLDEEQKKKKEEKMKKKEEKRKKKEEKKKNELGDDELDEEQKKKKEEKRKKKEEKKEQKKKEKEEKKKKKEAKKKEQEEDSEKTQVDNEEEANE